VLLSLTPLAPAAAPRGGPKPGLVTRVYSVADLVVPIGVNNAPGKTLDDQLIQLVESMVTPASWSSAGGSGQIDYYPPGMALVVRQTPDVHEHISELLSALRRLQDVEVTVETRFLSVSPEAMERLGLDLQGSKTPGMTILDDTQVHMLLEAMQGDRRANVM